MPAKYRKNVTRTNKAVGKSARTFIRSASNYK